MTFSIGDVLDQLSDEFPDITVSKIRFLESQGLIAPMRTASGFRMFSEIDITKLKWILLHQRDRFLPLKVIKEFLATLNDDEFSNGNLPVFDFESSGALALEGTENQNENNDQSENSDSDNKLSHLSAVPAAISDISKFQSGQTGQSVQSNRAGKSDELESSSGVATLVQEAPADVRRNSKTDRRTHKMARNLSAVSSYDSILSELDTQGLVGSTEAMTPKKTKSNKKSSKSENVLSLEAMTIETGISGPVLKELVRYGVLSATGSGNAMVFSSDELQLANVLAPLLERGIEPRHIKTYALFASREVGFLEHVVQDDLRKRNPEAREIAQEKAKQFIQDTARLKEILLLRALKNETPNK